MGELEGVRLPEVCRPRGGNILQPPPPLSLQMSLSFQTSIWGEEQRRYSGSWISDSINSSPLCF